MFSSLKLLNTFLRNGCTHFRLLGVGGHSHNLFGAIYWSSRPRGISAFNVGLVLYRSRPAKGYYSSKCALVFALMAIMPWLFGTKVKVCCTVSAAILWRCTRSLVTKILTFWPSNFVLLSFKYVPTTFILHKHDFWWPHSKEPWHQEHWYWPISAEIFHRDSTKFVATDVLTPCDVKSIATSLSQPGLGYYVFSSFLPPP